MVAGTFSTYHNTSNAHIEIGPIVKAPPDIAQTAHSLPSELDQQSSPPINNRKSDAKRGRRKSIPSGAAIRGREREGPAVHALFLSLSPQTAESLFRSMRRGWSENTPPRERARTRERPYSSLSWGILAKSLSSAIATAEPTCLWSSLSLLGSSAWLSPWGLKAGWGGKKVGETVLRHAI